MTYEKKRFVPIIDCHCLPLQSQEQGYNIGHPSSTDLVFGQSNDELSPPPASELMSVVTCAEGTELEEALREISREISSEFSCARDTDLCTSPGWFSMRTFR